MTNRNYRLFFFTFIFLTDLFIRLEFIKKIEIDNPIRADAPQYMLYGYNLKSHFTFSQEVVETQPEAVETQPTPDAYRSPGYPVFIALAFIFGGEKGFYALSLFGQAVLSALLAVFTYILGIRWLSSWAAICASLLVAISPHLVSMFSYLLTETLFSFLLLSALLCYYTVLKCNAYKVYIGAGLLFGLAYLTHETILLIPLLFAALSFYYSFLIERKLLIKRDILKLVAFLIVFLSFPFAWTVRNAVQAPQDAPKASLRAISTMSHGAYPNFIYENPDFKYYPYREDPEQPAFGSSLNNFSKILWERVTERPLRYFSWYFLEKPYYLWSWDNLQSQFGTRKEPGRGDVYVYPVKNSLYMKSKLADTSRLIMKWLHPLVLIFAFIGFPVSYITVFKTKKPKPLWQTPIPIYFICIYYPAIYMVFAPWPRYSVPFRPELYLCALWTVSVGIDLLLKNKNRI